MLVKIGDNWFNPQHVSRIIPGTAQDEDSPDFRMIMIDGGEVWVRGLAEETVAAINDAELELQKQAFLATHNAFMDQPIKSSFQADLSPDDRLDAMISTRFLELVGHEITPEEFSRITEHLKLGASLDWSITNRFEPHPAKREKCS